jgi:Zn-dependent protease with chaperone function
MIPRNTMDFFGSQDVARRKTFLLLIYYSIAITMIVVMIHVGIPVFYFPLKWLGAVFREHWGLIDELPKLTLAHIMDRQRLAHVAVIVVPVILAGTFYRIWQLSAGGHFVAWLLNGTKVNEDTIDPHARQLLNIVEEMSIASQVPRPTLYIMNHEPGINAFAAGFKTSDAVIGVTRGCVQILSREEQEGIIAHEFSHILNGDMVLNTRLAGIIHGILFLGVTSRYIFNRLVSMSMPKEANEPAMFGIILLFLTAPVLAITHIGVIPARLIKSAICRQREYLADASAVQFTRNPAGIASALKVIAGFVSGSRILSPHAEEASHFFVANGMGRSIFTVNLLSTHPPITRRIKRIDPLFNGETPFVGTTERAEKYRRSPFSSLQMAKVGAGSAQSSFRVPPPASKLGSFSRHDLNYASDTIAGLPQEITGRMYDPLNATALMFFLLLSPDATVRNKQMEYVACHAEPEVYTALGQLAGKTVNVDDGYRLPLAMLLLAAHEEAFGSDYDRLRETVDHLIGEEDNPGVFEFVLQRLLKRHIDPVRKSDLKKRRYSYAGIRDMLPAVSCLLSCMAYAGCDSAPEAEKAFSSATSKLHVAGGQFTLRDIRQCSLDALDSSLESLQSASPKVRKTIMTACVASVSSHEKPTVEESEMLALVADALDLSIPLPSQRSSA